MNPRTFFFLLNISVLSLFFKAKNTSAIFNGLSQSIGNKTEVAQYNYDKPDLIYYFKNNSDSEYDHESDPLHFNTLPPSLDALIDTTYIFLDLCKNDIPNIPGFPAICSDTIFSVTLQGASGDSIITYDVQILLSPTFDIMETLCENSTIIINGNIYNTTNPTGTEIFASGASNGCDSIINIDLSFFPNIETTIDIELEPGMEFNGIPIFSDTSFIEFLIAENGCDSIVTTHISILTSTDDLFEKELDLHIYPNPSSGDFYIELDLPEAMEIEVYTTDILGRQTPVFSKNKIYQKGKQNIKINTSQLISGIYWMVFKSSDKLYFKKIIKR